MFFIMWEAMGKKSLGGQKEVAMPQPVMLQTDLLWGIAA